MGRGTRRLGRLTAVESRNGSALHATGTLRDGRPAGRPALHNACDSGSGRDLTADVGRTPVPHGPVDGAAAADLAVRRGAGAGRAS